MTKQNGLGDAFYLSGYDLSGDIGSLSSIHGGPAPLEVTGINKSAFERIGGKRDAGIAFMAFFNDAAGQAHPRLSLLPTADQIGTYCRSTTLGKPAASMVAKQPNYDPTRGTDGSFIFNIGTLANGYGLEWGVQLTAGTRTDDTGATNGTGVDLGSASPGAFGLQAYLHVTAFSGTDATIKIQESSDNGSGDAFADVTGGGFTQITSGPTHQRIATGAINVERYLRVVTVTTGGFSSLSFQVMAIRNDTQVLF
jgi:hypothetical protein